MRPTPPSAINYDRAYLATLFLVGLALRWLFADGDFVGDDAWYLYLSRSLGRELAAQGEHPWFHIGNRPLYYAVFHVSTYAGLSGFRLLGCAIGATLPVLAFQAARRGGASAPAATIASSALCLQAQQLKYTALAFPDGLAALLALVACLALASGALGWACIWAAACVAAKESFIAVPVLIALLSGPARLRLMHWIALGCPLFYVAGLAVIPLFVPSLRMQGWSTTPLTLNAARNMWVGPEVWPFILWLAWNRQVRVLLLWLALPAFYVLWSVVLGRGIAPWYVLGPAALASVAVAHALDFTRRASAKHALATRVAALVLCAGCFAPLPLYGLLRTREKLSRLNGRLPTPSAAPQIVALIESEKPERLLLINCFWAFGYSHLRAGQPPAATWWHRPEDSESVLQNANSAAMIVACHDDQHAQAEHALRRLPRPLLLDNGAYLVLGAQAQ